MQDTRKKNTVIALCIQVLIFLSQAVFYYLYSRTQTWSFGIGISLSATMFFGALGTIALWLLWNYYNDTKLVKRSTLQLWGGICLLLSAFPIMYPLQMLMMYPELAIGTLPYLALGVPVLISALVLIKHSEVKLEKESMDW